MAACSTACGSTLRSSTRGETVSIMCQIEDITERVGRCRPVLHLAQHDSLTGCWNRGAFMVRAHEAVGSLDGRAVTPPRAWSSCSWTWTASRT